MSRVHSRASPVDAGLSTGELTILLALVHHQRLESLFVPFGAPAGQVVRLEVAVLDDGGVPRAPPYGSNGLRSVPRGVAHILVVAGVFSMQYYLPPNLLVADDHTHSRSSQPSPIWFFKVLIPRQQLKSFHPIVPPTYSLSSFHGSTTASRAGSVHTRVSTSRSGLLDVPCQHALGTTFISRNTILAADDYEVI